MANTHVTNEMTAQPRIDLTPVIQSFDVVMQQFFSAVSPANADAHGDAVREVLKLFVAVSEAKTRIEAMPLKLAYLGLLERYLSANRAVTGVANDDEANAIRLFANDHVSYLLHATRVIFQGQRLPIVTI